MTLTVELVEHPLVADALARIRDRDTPNALFRTNLERIGMLLLADATRELPTVAGTVDSPLATAAAIRIARQPVIVPILRAGLGFSRPAQELMPDADIGFIGMSRNETTLEPETYVNKLPASLAGRPLIVLDPMLATGGSLVAALRLLIDRGASTPITVVCALAAPEGLATVEASNIDVRVFTAAVDERLNDQAFIVPGLGDAGDRQFGAAHDVNS